MKRTIILLFTLLPLVFSVTLDLPLQNIRYEIKQFQGFDRIYLSDGAGLDRPGAPETPITVFSFCLPSGQYVADIQVVSEDYEPLPGDFRIYPEQISRSMDEPPQFTGPDPAIYNSTEVYPFQAVIGFHSGNLRGQSIGQISLCPFRYQPLSGRLSILKALRVEVTTGVRSEGFHPRRESSLSRAFFEHLVNCAVFNSAPPPPIPIEENSEDLEPSLFPSYSGPPVDLVIITTEAQRATYEKFADFKKKFGFNTALRTMTWIEENYSGFDGPERVRNFIRDAVEKWGTSFILLGGDVPEIPVRIARMEPLVGPWPTHIATDLYYSDLDSNWNWDGDNNFGEIEDSLDLYPDVLVGRIPSHSDSDAAIYLDKEKNYLFPPSLAGFTRALFVSSDWWTPGDARAASSRIAAHYPPNIDTCFINETTLQELKDSLYSSWGIIGVLAHGDVNDFRVRISPRTYATNFFFDSLMPPANIIQPLMYAITCYTNPFEVDALGEHWVMNPHGGGIGYIGPSYSSSAGVNEAYMATLVDSIFSLTMAGALAYTKFFWIPRSLYWDNWERSYQFSLNLLGDPTVTVWDSIPRNLEPVLADPDTINIGWDTITISLAYRVKFSAVFYKTHDFFVRDSGLGSVRIPLKTTSPGFLNFTINAPGFRLYQDSVYIRSYLPHLVMVKDRIVDSLANGNSEINPDEDIFLYVRLMNNGTTAAQNVYATISCPDTLLTLIQDSAAYPDIGPNSSADNTLPFHFRTSDALPDEHALNCRIILHYSGQIADDSLQLISHAPLITHFGQSFDWRGDTAGIVLFLQNRGHAVADSLTARIRSDSLVVLDSVMAFPAVPFGPPVSSTPDSFRIILASGAALHYQLSICDHGREIIGREIGFDSLFGPDTLWSEGRKATIILQWSPVRGATGYRIYRAIAASGPYQFLDNRLEPSAYYEDRPAASATDYYYFITAVDSSMNESPPSDTVKARTNPLLASGWPVTMRGYAFSSPNFGDLDPGYPGLEVVVGGMDGAVYEWHCDGTPVVGAGALLQTGGQIWSSPAVGDIDNDGSLEIALGMRFLGSDNFYVMDGRGLPRPGWPKSLEWGVLTSPVLSDIDGDGKLEIFVIAESGKLYAFRYDGSPAFNDSCVLKQLYGGYLGTPAIGDINNDGFLEIVCGGGDRSDSLFVWDHLGHYLPPFPVSVVPRMKYSPVLGDICGDNHLEICFYTDSTQLLNVVSSNGAVLWQQLFNLGDVEASPILADLAGSARPEIICGNNLGLAVYDSLGNLLPGFPLYGMEHDWKLPIAADLDADSVYDIACGSSAWALFGHKPDGSVVTGFPIPMGNRVECSPAVADLNQDGKLELMSGDFGFHFYVFNLNSEVFDWPKFRYDQYNTGCYRSGNWHGIRTNYTYRGRPVFFLNAAPNPFRDRINIRFGSGLRAEKSGIRDEELGISIYDVSGRLVKSFTLSPMLYAQSLLWDGSDDLGRTVAAGVYFIRLEAADKAIIRKIIRVR